HVARPLVDGEPLVAAHLHFGIGCEATETFVLVGLDDDLSASAHDRAVTLLDDGVAALIGASLPLRAYLIDARGALRTRGASALRTGDPRALRTSGGASVTELLGRALLAGRALRPCTALLGKSLLSRETLL